MEMPLGGGYEIVLEPHPDERGVFIRRFSRAVFEAKGLESDFFERSLSRTKCRGTIRGLHFQTPPYGETKLVRCVRGAAYDVLVDLRRGSATFGRWHAVILSRDAENLVYIPSGFAHGFQTLEDDTEMDYEITPGYRPDASVGVRYDDPKLAVNWPLPPVAVSERDLALPSFETVASILSQGRQTEEEEGSDSTP